MRELVSQILVEDHNKNKRSDFAYTAISTEGFVTAMVADVGHQIHNNVSTVIGYVEGLHAKQQSINEIAESTIEWLKDEARSNKNLDLDMGTFKTWLKTSEVRLYRYYYLLSDPLYNEIVANLKKGEISELERLFEHMVDKVSSATTLQSSDMKDRKSATRMLDGVRTINDLIVLVEKYRARCNQVFDLLKKQDRSIKGFPFQLMRRGINDLRQTVKKIVNLAS